MSNNYKIGWVIIIVLTGVLITVSVPLYACGYETDDSFIVNSTGVK